MNIFNRNSASGGSSCDPISLTEVLQAFSLKLNVKKFKTELGSTVGLASTIEAQLEGKKIEPNCTF